MKRRVAFRGTCSSAPMIAARRNWRWCLAAHGVHDAASECRELCDAGRDGTRLRTLIAAADRIRHAARAHRRPEALRLRCLASDRVLAESPFRCC